MTTTPTKWGGEVPFSNFFTDFGPQVVTLKDGTFSIVWERDGGDLVGRHFNELGGFTGGDFLATLSAATTQEMSGPQVFQQADGKVIVNFTQVFGPTDLDIRSHYSNEANPTSSSIPLENTGLNEALLDSTALPGGGSVNAFLFEDAGGVANLCLRFVNANGLPVSNRIVFATESAGQAQQNPAVEALPGDAAAVAYEVFNKSTFAREVRVQVRTADGGFATGVLQASAGDQNAGFPDIVALKNNTFVVAWQQNNGIAFRQFSNSGVALDPLPVVIPGSVGFKPVLTALNDGGFIAAWTQADGRESDGSPDLDIFLQRFDGLGNAIGDRVHFDEAGDQGLFNLSIGTLADGRVVVAYGSETSDSTNVTTLDYQILDPRNADVFGTTGNDNIVGREENCSIYGLAGNDKLTGRAGIDVLEGGEGSDTLKGAGGNDRLEGGAGSDLLDGGAGRDTAIYWRESAGYTVSLATGKAGVTGQTPGDTLVGIENVIGTAFNDVLTGNNAANVLEGGVGGDRLNGGSGADTLIGNAGKDVLQGGSGADRFTYLGVEESARGSNRDSILEFNRGEGDKIDLRTIDGNANVHDSAFTFIGKSAFSGVAGQLHYSVITGGLLVAGDVNGDKVADFEVQLQTTLKTLMASDFML